MGRPCESHRHRPRARGVGVECVSGGFPDSGMGRSVPRPSAVAERPGTLATRPLETARSEAGNESSDADQAHQTVCPSILRARGKCGLRRLPGPRLQRTPADPPRLVSTGSSPMIRAEVTERRGSRVGVRRFGDRRVFHRPYPQVPPGLPHPPRLRRHVRPGGQGQGASRTAPNGASSMNGPSPSTSTAASAAGRGRCRRSRATCMTFSRRRAAVVAPAPTMIRRSGAGSFHAAEFGSRE